MRRAPSALVISVPDVWRAWAVDRGAVATATAVRLAGAAGPPVAASGGEFTDAEQPLMWTQVFDPPGKLAWASGAAARTTRQALIVSAASARVIRAGRRGVADMSSLLAPAPGIARVGDLDLHGHVMA